MTWIGLSWNACRRRPLRTFLTAAGVGIAIGMSFCLLMFQRGYRRGLQAEFDRLGAHILVVPKGCPYDAASLALHGANWPCYLQDSYLQEVKATTGIAAAAPALMSAIFDAQGGRAVYVGIDTNMLALKAGWKLHGSFPRAGEALVGAQIAKQFIWTTGKEIALPGLKGARAKVAGVLEPTGSAEDSFIFLPLLDAQKQFKRTNQLTHVLVRLRDANEMDRVVHDLRGCGAGLHMNVVPLAHLFQTIQTLTNSTRWLLACAGLAAILAAGATVSATQLIAVVERGPEIGVLRALGASRADVFKIISGEAALICLLGAVAGVVSAFFLMGIVETGLRAHLPFAPSQRLLTWNWTIAFACVAGGVALGALASLGPAWRAADLAPILAMRKKEA